MNQKKSFIDQLTNFIIGEPGPGLSESELQTIRDLSQKVDTLLTSLNRIQANSQPAGRPAATLIEPAEGQFDESQQLDHNFNDLAEQVRKLAKTQFKTNSLQESQLAQQKETLEGLQKSVSQQEKFLAELGKQREQAVEAAQLELLKSLLPVLDSLDAAFGSGRRQVLQLPMDREVRQAIIAWLDGIRLARMRLLDLLAAYDIRPISTVGQPFNPHYHVAVATDMTGRAANGVIVSEDRPGYASPTRVLREAEVTVARSS